MCKNKDLYLTAGHQVFHGKGTGAHGIKEKGKQFDEALEARKLVDAIIAHQKLWYKLDTFTDLDSTSLSGVIAEQIRNVDENYVCIDVHFNAGPASATGCEVFIPTKYTTQELELATDLAKAIGDTLEIRLRTGRLMVPGVKQENESQHPSIGILNRPNKAINILLEICFITNENDVASYRKNYFKLVQQLSDVIGNYRKVKEVAL